MTDWILHVDLDQFLAAVEKRRRPELRTVPVIVGGAGDPTRSRQVVACASYEARAFGVHAGMPLRAAAKKCPDAVFLANDSPAYEAASAQVMDLLRTLPVQVEVWGWDEAFAGAETDDPEALATTIRTVLGEQAQLSCSVGIGDNKLRAKMATGYAKPAGIYRVTAAEWNGLLADRPTSALWGIGSRTAARLTELGITTVGQLASAEPNLLATAFGPTTGPWLLRLGRGEGETAIRTEPWEARSRSKVKTFPADLTERGEMQEALTGIARAVAAEVVAADRVVERVAVTVRTASFYTRTKIMKLATPTTDIDTIAEAALVVLDRFEVHRPVRLLGVRVELVARRERS
ncbi:DNA polymerase IV [Antrihabitans sp. YC2-6]|uniref:DNA polymerase IV n=1 Tax=Antrihabitans sp. YC2-6 TaxID=2799498 RepID=UPI0018F4585F|nr:DNA polymerase IV [Antrihabitans sp. YC2-6]MBJ8347984.1 DNA polymerase IV [Antrihabitans sp. YC2-6]